MAARDLHPIDSRRSNFAGWLSKYVKYSDGIESGYADWCANLICNH